VTACSASSCARAASAAPRLNGQRVARALHLCGVCRRGLQVVARGRLGARDVQHLRHLFLHDPAALGELNVLIHQGNIRSATRTTHHLKWSCQLAEALLRRIGQCY
jgi:hypothetical protein